MIFRDFIWLKELTVHLKDEFSTYRDSCPTISPPPPCSAERGKIRVCLSARLSDRLSTHTCWRVQALILDMDSLGNNKVPYCN